LKTDPRFSVISSVIEAVRPSVRSDGGDLELVAIDGDCVRVRLTGRCTSCGLAGQTLGGVRRRLMQALGSPVMVVPAVDG
jgi:Fe-S cluster biogenesis protein NfuA